MIPNIDRFIGRRIALLLWSGEEDAAIIVGRLDVADGAFLLTFENDNPPALPLEADWLGRLKPVTEEMADIFDGADLVLPLAVGDLPDAVWPLERTDTGLVWPDER